VVAERLRLMAVHAHPDDESSKGAATMAKYVAEGVDVLVVTCTGGERGSVLNPKLDRPDVWENIADIRRAEMDAARAILGVDQAWLGFVDSGLPEGDPLPPLPEGCFGLVDAADGALPLIKLIREFRPHVMTTYDENGGYPHPDHLMCHNVSMAAFDAAGDAEQHPELGAPWQPLKLYYDIGFHKAKIIALHEGLLAAGLESHYKEWLDRWEDEGENRDRGARITTRVECADYFTVRDDALRAHATQVDPDGFWFQVPMEVQRKAWPTEDFELVKSFVDSPIPESDLFAGVRTAVTERSVETADTKE
jgi:mycothiol S-conjugate amidase